MTWVDYTLITIVILSALFGLYRGIVRELLSLLGWVISFWLAMRYSHYVAGFFEGAIENESLRYGLSFGAIFISSLVAFTLISFFMGKLFNLPGIGFINRSVGMVFGITRGILIATILVFFGNMTAYADDPLWRESTTIDTFSGIAAWATDFRAQNNFDIPELEERINELDH